MINLSPRTAEREDGVSGHTAWKSCSSKTFAEGFCLSHLCAIGLPDYSFYNNGGYAVVREDSRGPARSAQIESLRRLPCQLKSPP